MKKIVTMALLVSLAWLLTTGKVEAQVAPTLTSLSPDWGFYGQEVTIQGSALCNGSQIVFYEGASEKARVSANPVITYSQIECVPTPAIPNPTISAFKFGVPNLLPNNYNVRLEDYSGQSGALSFAIPSQIIGISPSEGNHGTAITITGSNFDTANSQIFLDNYQLNVSNLSTSNQLTANIPTSVPFGFHTVHIWSGTVEANYTSVSQGFTLRPHLNFLTPSRGLPNDVIAIGGIYFGTDLKIIKVRFGKLEITPSQILLNGTALLTKVPAGLLGGAYEVTVVVNGIESDNRFYFNLTAPAPEAIPSCSKPNQSPGINPGLFFYNPCSRSFSKSSPVVVLR